MGLRYVLIALVMSFALPVSVPAWAQATQLKATEIAKLLTQNTIHGIWDGTEYRQYFGDDGLTIYATRKAQSALGKWRVNASNNTYESWWSGNNWDSYKIFLDGDDFHWLDETGKRWPFKLLPGQQLLLPAK